MRRVRLLMLGGLFALLVAPLAIPTPASATLTDPCSADADVTGDDGTSYGAITPKTNSGVYTVPIKGSASYNGLLVGVQEPEDGRAHDGFVDVALPLGFSVNIKSWSESDSTKVSDSGTVSWDLPAATPRGVEMTVSGEHHDPLGPCSGSITVKLDGGLLDSAVGVATAVGTVLLAAFTLLTGIPTKP